MQLLIYLIELPLDQSESDDEIENCSEDMTIGQAFDQEECRQTDKSPVNGKRFYNQRTTVRFTEMSAGFFAFEL